MNFIQTFVVPALAAVVVYIAWRLFDTHRKRTRENEAAAAKVEFPDFVPMHADFPVPPPPMVPDDDFPMFKDSFAHHADELPYCINIYNNPWLVMPRVLIEDMPAEWRGKLTLLLREYEARFPNPPCKDTAVVIKNRKGQFRKPPKWVLRYQKPDRKALARARGEYDKPHQENPYESR